MQGTWLALVALMSFGTSQHFSESKVPTEYGGVWKVTSAWDGNINPATGVANGELSVDECDMLEVIICENRAIIVQESDAIVCSVRVLADHPHLKVELMGISEIAKQDGACYAMLKLATEDTLQFAFCESNAESISEETGSNQYVIKASRQNR